MHTQVADADGDDPLTALQDTARRQRELGRIEELGVRRARLRGLTWAQIADALGTTRRVVRQRYGGSRRSHN